MSLIIPPPVCQHERKIVEIKLMEGMKSSEVKPYVDNLGGSILKIIDVVVESLFYKSDSANKVMNAKEKWLKDQEPEKKKKRRSRAKRKKKTRRLSILMETIITKEVCERKINLE
jgi:hypothetical protein